jgi:hypothetical protein
MREEDIQNRTNRQGDQDTKRHGLRRVLCFLCCSGNRIKTNEGKEHDTSARHYSCKAIIPEIGVVYRRPVTEIYNTCSFRDHIRSVVSRVDKLPAEDNEKDNDTHLYYYDDRIYNSGLLRTSNQEE